jgi:hypothetical protein
MSDKANNSKNRSRRNVSPRSLIRLNDKNSPLSQSKRLSSKGKTKANDNDIGSPPVIHFPIRIRTGLNEKRPSFIPALGEPLFTTDDRRFWVGDGGTPGGIPVSVSQWPIADIEQLADLEDAEIGDFAFYKDRTRCFMLVNPPPTSKIAWMELHVEPLQTDDERTARRYLNAIQEYLLDILIEEKLIINEDDRLLPKKTTNAKLSKLMTDRRALNTYLANVDEEKEFPELAFNGYAKL